MSLAHIIKLEAHRLGFALAGFTTPEPPPHMPAYESWLKLGRHGSMEYLADERARKCRYDPRLILPECRSILMLGFSYPVPETARLEGETGSYGQLAAYACGLDYHVLLPERLKALSNFIEKQAGNHVPQRCYTDTGPIMERDLAQRAGLGWIGKNTCLINPKSGSYFLLAEILLGIDLEPDPPFTADRCGICTRCIQACPTSCIQPNRTLDARRCIAYLTIENKGEIPTDLRSKMDNWVFGCDICQVVCPWNRFAVKERDQSLPSYPLMTRRDLRSDLRLIPQGFNQTFKASPVKRARRRGYLRNVAVALGNHGDRADISALEEAMEDIEPLIRSHAGWALDKVRKRLQTVTG